MPVPEGIPLAQADDGVQRVVLEQEDPARGHPGDSLRQSRGLIGLVHHAEGVDDQVSRTAVGDRLQAPVVQQAEPRPSVRTGELDHRPSTGEPPGRRQPLDGVDGLRDERFGLGAERLLGLNGLAQELCQAARRAQPHLERVRRVGIPVVGRRKMIAGRLVAQVEHHLAGMPCARSTGVTAHHGLLSTGTPASLA